MDSSHITPSLSLAPKNPTQHIYIYMSIVFFFLIYFITKKNAEGEGTRCDCGRRKKKSYEERRRTKKTKKEERKPAGCKSAMVNQQKESRKIDAEIRTTMGFRSLLVLLCLHKRHDIHVRQTDRHRKCTSRLVGHPDKRATQTRRTSERVYQERERCLALDAHSFLCSDASVVGVPEESVARPCRQK